MEQGASWWMPLAERNLRVFQRRSSPISIQRRGFKIRSTNVTQVSRYHCSCSSVFCLPYLLVSGRALFVGNVLGHFWQRGAKSGFIYSSGIGRSPLVQSGLLWPHVAVSSVLQQGPAQILSFKNRLHRVDVLRRFNKKPTPFPLDHSFALLLQRSLLIRNSYQRSSVSPLHIQLVVKHLIVRASQRL